MKGFSGLKAPAATDVATLIVVFGSSSDTRPSHDATAVAVRSSRIAAAASVMAASSEAFAGCFMAVQSYEQLAFSFLPWAANAPVPSHRFSLGMRSDAALGL